MFEAGQGERVHREGCANDDASDVDYLGCVLNCTVDWGYNNIGSYTAGHLGHRRRCA